MRRKKIFLTWLVGIIGYLAILTFAMPNGALGIILSASSGSIVGLITIEVFSWLKWDKTRRPH